MNYELRIRKRRRGFTIIELLIVIALIVILGSIGFLSLVEKNRRDEFNVTVQRATVFLNQAWNKSVTQDGLSGEAENQKWGVRFYRGTDTTDGGFEICKVDDYLADGIPAFGLYVVTTSISVRDYFALPSGVSFDGTSTFGAVPPIICDKSIGFSQITGDYGMTSGVRIFMTENPDVSSTITIYPSGLIGYTGREEE